MRFAFRVDSSPEMGLGHLMRCLTLANGLRDFGFECFFICRDFANNGTQHILENNFSLEILPNPLDVKPTAQTWLGVSAELDAADTIKVLNNRPVDWLVVDHYSIDEAWSAELRKVNADLKIMVIDDLADRKHDCDLLLDQTYGRQRSDYHSLIPKRAIFCGGSDYALLRPSFLKARNELKAKAVNQLGEHHILVTLGGGDIMQPLGIISKALVKLAQENSFSVTAVIGDADESILAPLKAMDCEVDVVKFSSDMASEMLKADFAIGAAGGTSWERCCVGLPTIVLTLADNQIEIAKILDETQSGISVKTEVSAIISGAKRLLSNDRLLQEMSANAAKLCDGKGVAKVIRALISDSLVFRKIEMSDAQFIYDARYKDGASEFYRAKGIPNFESHVNWLEKAIKDDQRLLAIISLYGKDIAHLRLDRDKDNALSGIVGICIAPKLRGKGIGLAMIVAMNKYFTDLGILRVRAEIHEDNIGSWVIFGRGGYKHLSTDSEGFMLYEWLAE